MNAKYLLLIQRQFDVQLTEREMYELQGFLAGNEGAAKLLENIRIMIEESQNLEIPDELKPTDAQLLLKKVTSAISKKRTSPLFALLTRLVACKPMVKHSDKSRRSAYDDDLAGFRKLRLPNAETSSRNDKNIGASLPTPRSLREKSHGAMSAWAARTPVEPHSERSTDAVSLAEAIKRRMLTPLPDTSHSETPQPDTSQPGTSLSETPQPVAHPHALKLHTLQFNNQPPGSAQSISESMDQLFSSSNWPAFDPQWAKDEAQNLDSDTQPNIPVGEIIEHINLIFGESAAPDAVATTTSSSATSSSTTPTSSATSSAATPRTQATTTATSSSSARQTSHATTTTSATSSSSATMPTGDSYPVRARLAPDSNCDDSGGHIKSIGRFLLDKSSEAAIANLSNPNLNIKNARILSDDEARALQECLSPIERLEKVAGCIILGYDGIVITNTLPDHADKDAFSAWALLTYINSHELVHVVGHAKLRQLVCRTQSGYLLLADFGQGLLLTVSDNASTDAIVPLMKSVRRVTAA